MKKFITVCLVLIFVLSCTVIGVAALDEDTHSETLLPEEEPLPPPATEETPPADSPITDVPADDLAIRNFGETVNYIWDNYAGEIFSGLTLVTSLVLAYFYKRGLVPVIWNGLDRISRAGEETEEKIAVFFERAEPILTHVSEVTSVADSLSDYVKTLEARVDAAENERARMEVLMSGVAEMLYGVFSAANLPVYAKEQLGARYHAIMNAINETGAIHENKETTDI